MDFVYLADGKTKVNNPLYIATRYVGPAAQGQIRAPWQPRLNLRVGKEFRLGEGSKVIEANADIFNLTNNGAGIYFSNGQYINSALGPGNPPTLPLGTMSASGIQSPRGIQLSFRFRF